MRRLLSHLALVCGAAGIALGAVLSIGVESLFDARAFSERTAASLADPRVASFAAERLTDAVLEQSPDLTAVGFTSAQGSNH